MIAHVMRLVLAAMLVTTALARFGPEARAAQTLANSWAEPAGAFTVQWQEPWVVQRQEPGLLLVANGSIAAVATISVPIDDINPSICLDAYVDATASPEVKAQQPFMEGKTSWRAYAAYDNLEVGAVDYFECQVTPDGKSLAVFAGGTTLMGKYDGIPQLIDLLGQWVVRPDGERGPAVAGDGWRLGVVDWVRGSVSVDLGLSPAPVGTDYLVVVADLANWQSTAGELPLASLAVQVSASEALIPVDIEASRTVAEYLGEVPVEQTIALDPGASRRIVLAFSVDASADNVGLSLAGNVADLVEDGVPARLVVLPSPGALPGMQSGVISNVIDGRTLLVDIADTGRSERVRLIGVGDSNSEAASYLSGFVGQTVMLESSDPAHPDDNRLQRYVWAVDELGLPAMVNASLLEQELASYVQTETPGRFDAMLSAIGGMPASTAGGQETVAANPAPQPDITPEAELTDADQAYLAELARYRESLQLSLQYYDMFMTAPTLDAEFFGHLGITVLGWAAFYDGIAQLQPTPRFADLHARLIAAFEPFDLLAHQVEPELDLILSGGTPQQQFAGFDYDVMMATVNAARPELESVIAEIEAMLTGAGITSDFGAIQ